MAASISPTTLSNGTEPYTGKKAYTKLHITAIRQSDGATNKTYIDWKITVEGTPWTTLYRLYCTLGGKVLYDGKPELNDWRAGDVVASGTNVEFSNNSDGSLSLYAYIKQQFYYGNGDTTRWTKPYYYQENDTTMVCSQIPRYCNITSFTISQNNETSVKGNWAVDANVSVAHCRHREKGTSTWSNWNQVAWPNFTYSGLSAGKTYEFQLKVKRQDSGLETESSLVTQSTFNYPYVTSTPDFVIGNTLTISIYNPIGRNCVFYLVGNNGEEIGGAQTTGTSMSGYAGQDVLNLLYRGIPNAQSGRYSVRLVVPDVSRDTTTPGGTYYIRGTETPTFNESYITEVADTLHVEDITGNSSKFIKGHNVLTGKITPMNPRNSANGSRYVINANANPSSQEITHENGVSKSFTLRNITTNYFSITAYDSRELSTPATKNISLVDYSNPVVRDLLINRTDGVGEYATLTASGTFTHWSGWNEIKKYNSIQKVYYRYREASSNSWYGWYDITNKLKQNANGSWSLEYTMDVVFTNTSKYVFEIYVQDLLEASNTKSGTLSTANAFVWRDLLNKWLGIGKKPGCTLDVAGDGWFDGRVDAVKMFKNGKSVIAQGTISDNCDYYVHDSENVISLRYVSGRANNRPVTTTGMDGMMIAYQPHPNYIYQLFIGGTNPVDMWTRAYVNGTWQSWVKIPTREEINNINSSISTLNTNVNTRCRAEYLGNNPNIDNYRYVSGTYGLYNCAKAPSTSIGVLEVICYTGDWCIQRFTEVGYGGTPAIWQRSFYSGTTWGPWHKIH